MKILFVIDKLNTGGVSSSLLNLLQKVNDRAECSLMVFSGCEIEAGVLPDNIKIVKCPKILNILGLSQKETLNSFKLLGIFRMFLVLISKVCSGFVARKLLFLFTKKISEYDVAISYTHDVNWRSLTTGCNQFVGERVEAKQKATFVHCDYARYGGYNPKQEKIYKKFDHIICVSRACRDSFIECFPSLRSSCRVVENFTDTDKISRLTKIYFKYDHSLFNIVTVCRLTEEKGISRALDTFSRLKDIGVKSFKWTIVGDGPDRKELEYKVSNLGLDNMVRFVGESKNPFYYMKDADAFLLPSFHEAAPMVFGECRAVGLPIITTNTISAKELVEDCGAGVVCENSSEGIFSVLKDILIKGKVVDGANHDINAVNSNADYHLSIFLEELHSNILK